MGLTPLARGRLPWLPGLPDFEVASYFGDERPPIEFVISLRAVVRRGESVLVFDEAGGTHVLPGGRREVGESLEGALLRELREETGCEGLAVVRRLGFAHFHLRAEPGEIAPPYSDFLQVVFAAEATNASERPGEPHVRAPRFVPLAETLAMPIAETERAFLTS